MRFAVVSLLLGALCGVALGDDAGLAPGDMSGWSVVCSNSATESERYAAAEFQALFKGLTGSELPLVEVAPQNGGAVFIGPDAVQVPGRLAAGEGLGEEGLRIKVEQDAICIDGGRPRGTLYGVYEFFEELCGVRFLTHDHTFFPDATNVNIPLGLRTHVPQFAFRWSYYGETMRFPDFAARLRVNTVSDDPKLGGKTGWRLVSHNVAYLVPPAKFGAEHPEYYALVDGQRKLEMNGGGPQLCMTNPDVLELVTQAVLEEIEKNPDATNINIAQMDNESYCTCANCAAIDTREESHAGATLALVNSVAERIEKTHPDVILSTYAYQYTRKPPKTLRARKNVMIQLCSIECCDFHAIDDPACGLNQIFCEDTAGWKKKADTIFIWHYNTNFRGYMLPFPNLRGIGKSVDYFANNNGRGVFMQAAGNGFSTELSDLRNYVMARCLWKPGRSSWQEAEEFCRLQYAEAAQPILDYLAYYHELVDNAGVHPTCFPTESALALNSESAAQIMRHFEDAQALAKSDEVRARVEKASLCAYRAALSAASMRLVYDNGLCRADASTMPPGLLDTYAALCARYEVSMEGEQTTLTQYLDDMRNLLDGVKAVQIENDFWRVMLLPEFNGKIVEMTYKPTGRNVIQPARTLSRFRFEDWVRQGEGPGSQSILAYEAQAEADKALFTLTTPDGSRFERRISLAGESVRVEMALTAQGPRMADFQVHPEYDTATTSESPGVLQIFVKAPGWTQANGDWSGALPTEAQSALIKTAAAGGSFAYYNQEARFGVEQRFDPEEYASLGLFWGPSRLQINLEMLPKIVSLAAGQQARYAYEIRYLHEAPQGAPL